MLQQKKTELRVERAATMAKSFLVGMRGTEMATESSRFLANAPHIPITCALPKESHHALVRSLHFKGVHRSDLPRGSIRHTTRNGAVTQGHRYRGFSTRGPEALKLCAEFTSSGNESSCEKQECKTGPPAV